MEKHKKIPKLRFPGFHEFWERKELCEISKRVTLRNNSNLVKNVFTNSAAQGIVNQRDFFDKDIANQNNLLNYYIVEKNDFIYNPRISNLAPVGPISRNHLGIGIMSPLYTVFKFTKGNLDFFETFFSTTFWYEYLESIANYGARFDRMNITIADFNKLPIPFPSLPEQTKIASFFTAIDQKLTLLKKKKSLLEQYKKGVMQRIFSQELRFKDENGNEFPEWEKKKLEDVAMIIMGQSPDSIKYNSDKIGKPLIQGNADIYNRKTKPRNWTTQYTKECNEGDLILTVRAPVGAVAKTTINAIIGRGVCAIRNKANTNIEFLFQFFLNFENKWQSVEQGSTFTAVSGLDIKKTKIHLPSIPEQTKIANFLTAIDEKINSVNKQIKGMEEWKKGLMQKMFC